MDDFETNPNTRSATSMTPLPHTKQPGFFGKIGRFFGNLIRSYFIFVGVIATLSLVAVGGLVATLAQQGGTKGISVAPLGPEDKVILKLDLDRPISEHQLSGSDKFYRELLGEQQQWQLADLETILRRAASDDHIKGVYIYLSPELAARPVTYTTLRRAIANVKAAGKKVHVHAAAADFWQYYMASAASEVSVAPHDELLLTGPVLQMTHFKDLLTKLGVTFEVVRAGKYKSAMEPLIANEPSEATLENYRAIEQSLLAHLAKSISQDRNVPPAQVRNWFRKSMIQPVDAKEDKIVDTIAYHQATTTTFKEAFEDCDYMDARDYLRATKGFDDPLTSSSPSEIGFIDAHGTIMMAGNEGGGDQIITADDMVEEIQYMKDREQVKAVVMRVDSPGGSAVASDIIWQQLKELAAQKPLIVSMGQVAASGGYYISGPAAKILAEPTTITGSIGVIAAVPHLQAVAEKWGVHFGVVTSSDRQALLNPGAPLSEEDHEVLGRSIDSFYDTFLTKMAEGRKMTKEAIHERAQGRVYTGAEALANGLVDQLGGLKDAFAEAKQAAKLNVNKLYKVATYQGRPQSILDCFGKDFDEVMRCMEKLETVVPPIGQQLQDASLPVPDLVVARKKLALWRQLFQTHPVNYLWAEPQGI